MLTERAKKRHIIVLISVLAVLLRLVQVYDHDSYTDEAVLAFRAIGMIDYDAAPQQTTPWQWLKEVPWWAHLSFHDHPIFFFLLQNVSMRLVGENLLGARLPAVLAGIASVYMAYLLGAAYWRPRAGIIAAAFLAVHSYHVWVSRLGLQDGVVVLELLIFLYALTRVPRDPRWWYGAWALFGIGIITKYTTLIFAPIGILFILLFRRQWYKDRAWWRGLLLFIVLTSPTWLYNIMLYATRGHFDFQLSAAFHQDVPEWTVRLGRTLVGDLKTRFTYFFAALHQGGTLSFLLLTITAVWYAVVKLITARDKKNFDRPLFFLLGSMFFLYGWFFVIGSTYRFVVMIVPLFVLLAAWMIDQVLSHINYPRAFGVLFLAFFVFETAYTINSYLLPRRLGVKNITYAEISDETQNFGFNQVGAYLEKLLDGRMTFFAGQPEYQFLADVQNERLERALQRGARPEPLMIIFDKNLNFLASLWYFQRYLVYDAWPVLSDRSFLDITGDEFEEFYRRQGVRRFVYIAAANEKVLRRPGERSDTGLRLKRYLDERGVQPKKVSDASGETTLYLYEF